MKTKLLSGCISALATPFSDGAIDYSSFSKLINLQEVASCEKDRISALVVSGTTGESATLSEFEKLSLLSYSLENSSLPIIMGSGSNDTQSAVKLSKKASHEGAYALLVVTPYYNKTNDEGIIKHYFSIAEESEVPIIVYNVPSRTGYDISLDSYVKLCEHENICGVKEASGNVRKILRLISLCSDKVSIYCGSDELNLPLLLSGADGIISVASVIKPRELARLCHYAKNEKLESAILENNKLSKLVDLLFCDVNPIPLKYFLYKKGLCENELRLPLCPLCARLGAEIDLYCESSGF